MLVPSCAGASILNIRLFVNVNSLKLVEFVKKMYCKPFLTVLHN
jgi:hypothetical protein